jgi:hypothetical protein
LDRAYAVYYDPNIKLKKAWEISTPVLLGQYQFLVTTLSLVSLLPFTFFHLLLFSLFHFNIYTYLVNGQASYFHICDINVRSHRNSRKHSVEQNYVNDNQKYSHYFVSNCFSLRLSLIFSLNFYFKI